MDTRLIFIFIFSALLGALIVITGCIKVLSKNGVIDTKAAIFVLIGFIFVALPVLSTVSIEWGDFKLLVNTTNKEVKAMQKTLDSLTVVNHSLESDVKALQILVAKYERAIVNPNIPQARKIEMAAEVNGKFTDLNIKIRSANSGLESATARNTKINRDLKKFEEKSWYRKP